MECILPRKLLRKELRAEFTLEVALIFPMIIFLIISLIYMGFYTHDRNILKSAAYNMALDKVFMEKAIDENDNAVNGFGLFSVRKVSTKMTEKQSVKVINRGKYEAPFTGVDLFMKSEMVEEAARAVSKMDRKEMYIFKLGARAVEQTVKRRKK